MSIQPAWQYPLDFFGARPIVIEPSPALLSSDGGLLPIRQFDERIRLTAAFAQALDDPRAPALSEHTFLEMVRSRIDGILADYEDQNDHDTLRSDPVFQVIAGRSPDGDDLASPPTLSRFENRITIASRKRLRDVFIDQFSAAFAQPPRRLVFDLDAVDDPAPGHQQLTFWHGFYGQNQYLPLFITCAANDQFVLLSLRPGTVHAALGADDDLEYLVKRLRPVWPDVVIEVRGDAGCGVPWMYDGCERWQIYYTFGLRSTAVLRRHSDALARHVIVKAEANAQGTNRRFMVSNRPGADLLPEAT
jgi:Transposase DDE domain group 1